MSACMSARSSRNAGVSTEFTASLTVEAIAESEVLCCSLNASLIPLATASSISSLEMVKSVNFFLYWRLPNLSFPIAFDCWSTHDGSDAKWFEIYWQDYKIFDKVSRAKDYACIEVEGSRDLSSFTLFVAGVCKSLLLCRFKWHIILKVFDVVYGSLVLQCLQTVCVLSVIFLPSSCRVTGKPKCCQTSDL